MTSTTDEEGGGCRCEASSQVQSIARNPKKVSHPDLCQRCETEYTIQDCGPDMGEIFACGIMTENIDAGCMSFNCSHFILAKRYQNKLVCRCEEEGRTCMCDPVEHPQGKTIAAIIDSEKANEALRVVGILKEHKRPVIIEAPSPHSYLDAAISKINEERAVIRNVAGARCFLCGKELGVNEPTIHGSCHRCWEASHD